ncbi:MAG: hypothetical protein ACE5IB_06370 [Candidatus Geothermarchaeales archaeon]
MKPHSDVTTAARISRAIDSAFTPFIVALVVSGVIEFLTIRIFSRLGAILPKEEAVFVFFNGTIFLGSVFFNAASLLAVLATIIAALILARQSSWIDRVSAVTFLALAQLSILFLLVSPEPLLSVTYNLASALVIVLLCITVIRKGGRRLLTLGVSALLAGYLTSYYFKVMPGISQLLSQRMEPNYSIAVFNLGEAIAVAGAFLLFAALALQDGLTTRRAVVSLTGIGAFAAAYLRSPWITSILATWTVGFTLFLPFPIYAAAIGVYLYLIMTSHGKGTKLHYAFLLIFLGGRMLQLTYLNLLAILGVFLLRQELHKTVPVVPDSTKSPAKATYP